MKIAIASGKGGTGKTTLSVNLAALLSENHKVVLTDLDVEEPNSGLFLHGNLVQKEIMYKHIPEWEESTCTLCGECQKNCNFHAIIQLGQQIMVFPELCHSCYACSELCPTFSLPMIRQRMGELKYRKVKEIDFVESHLDIGQEQAVPLIAQTLGYVEEHFGHDEIRIYDAPPGTSCPVIEASKGADYIILVTEPTPFGFHDLKLAVETMLEMQKKFGVVINRHGIGDDKEIRDYCKNNKIPIIATIPNKREIARLYSGGELIYDKLEDVRAAFEKIRDHVLRIGKGGRS
ncbi:MAG: ATP-binding protein [Bacteroidales bacterium]|nr:ATP-binding protein [Bacteroidales bacterium]MCF8388245.1 ATP-binding protein [Bacteroidales bacterium]MCF8398991.1 ATP-binding protein [Bacteroidales bacterium]